MNRNTKKIINKNIKSVNNAINKTKKTIVKTAYKIGDDIKNEFRFNKRFDYPPILNEYIDKYQNNIIVGATIYRHKVNDFITKTLNILSDSNFDKLFHLRCYFMLDNGQEIYIEKNERINCGIGNKQTDHDFLNVDSVDIPQNLTFGQLITNTASLMGEKFLTYSASSNNCQYFIRAVFQSNNMLQPKYESFIKQSTEQLFNNNANLRKFANTVTDIAGEANAIIQGGELDELDDLDESDDYLLYCMCCNKIVSLKDRQKHNKSKSHIKLRNN